MLKASCRLGLAVALLATLAALDSNAAKAAREQAVFDRVMENLDAGGVFLLVVNGEDFMRGLPDKLDQFWQAVLTVIPEEEKQGEDFALAQGVVSLLLSSLAESGLPELNAVGMSSKRVDGRLFRNRMVFDRQPMAEPGLLWRLGGSVNRPLESFMVFPENTVLASYGVFDLSTLFSWVQNQVETSDLPQARQAMADWLLTTRQMGFDFEKMFASVNGDMGWVVTMDRERRLQIPVEDREIEIPHLELAFLLGCQDDEIFRVLDTLLNFSPMPVARLDREQLRLRTIELPVDEQWPLSPTLARFGDYLVVASTRELAEAIVAVNRGQAPSLFADPEFNRLRTGLPGAGTGFSYLAPELMEEYYDFIQRLTREDEEAEEMQELFEQMMEWFGSRDQVAVSVTTVNPHGWTIDSHNTQSLRQLVLLPVVAVPAMVAGMALPAFATARERAQEVHGMSILRQLALGCHIYAMDHNGKFPESLEQLFEMNYLDPSLIEQSEVSYLYFGQGQLVDGFADPAQTVLIAEPPTPGKGRFNVAFVDGHVEVADADSLQQAAILYDWTLPTLQD